MLIPHLHFNGTCSAAIAFYEKAFQTKAEIIIYSDDGSPESKERQITHAVMRIHDQIVFLNDRFGVKEPSPDVAVHLIVMFSGESEFLTCFDMLKENSITIDPLETLPYSSLAVQFIDQLGVQWGLMIDASTAN